MVKAHGFSKAVAYQRVTIAKAGLQWPRLLNMIEDKKFSIESATLVGIDLLENKDESILERAAGLTKEQIEILIFGKSNPLKNKDSVRVMGVITREPESAIASATTQESVPLGLDSTPPRSENKQKVDGPASNSCPMVLPDQNSVEPDAKYVLVKVSFATNDHVEPFALGGKANDPMNIRILCSAHNKFRASQTFMR